MVIHDEVKSGCKLGTLLNSFHISNHVQFSNFKFVNKMFLKAEQARGLSKTSVRFSVLRTLSKQQAQFSVHMIAESSVARQIASTPTKAQGITENSQNWRWPYSGQEVWLSWLLVAGNFLKTPFSVFTKLERSLVLVLCLLSKHCNMLC